MSWTPTDLVAQHDRTWLVTGVSPGGLGFFTALEAARAGARVVLAGRKPEVLDETANAIRADIPAADLVPLDLDLASLSSVRRAAAQVPDLGPVQVLVNNAGVMMIPYTRTEDGFELTMGTNHFGPFLFTGLLMPHLVASGTSEAPSRVVTVSSALHAAAWRAPLADPRTKPRLFNRYAAYCESKLANLLFAYELQHRATRDALPVLSMAAHPGFASTRLTMNGPGAHTPARAASILDATVRAMAQPAHQGAWPTLYAATEDLAGGTYVGPSQGLKLRGTPSVQTSSRLSRDAGVQRAMWQLSEQAVDLSWL